MFQFELNLKEWLTLLAQFLKFVVMATLRWVWLLLLVTLVGGSITYLITPNLYEGVATFAVVPADGEDTSASELSEWAEIMTDLTSAQEESLMIMAQSKCESNGEFPTFFNRRAIMEIRIVRNSPESAECSVKVVGDEVLQKVAQFLPGRFELLMINHDTRTSLNKLNTSLNVSATIFAVLWLLSILQTLLASGTVRTEEQISNITDLPVIAWIGPIRMPGGSGLITIYQPRSPIAEQFRVLRTAIQFSAPDEYNKILLVTSGGIGEGKSTISSNLAVVLAQAGHKTLLIDADMHRPSLHSIFGISNKRGLSSMMLEYKNNDKDALSNLVLKTVQETRIDGLGVLACGPLSPNPSELLGSTKMKHILKGLVELYDFILLDSPPVLSVTDASILNTMADSSILVALTRKTGIRSLRKSIERLKSTNENLIGIVMNKAKFGVNNFYQYGFMDNFDSEIPYLEDVEDVIDEDHERTSASVTERILRRQSE